MFDQEIAGFRLVMAGDRYLCVEGVQKLLSISETEVSLKLRKKVLDVAGEGITIREIENGRIVLLGTFSAFTFK